MYKHEVNGDARSENDGIDALARAAGLFHLRVEAEQLRHRAGGRRIELEPWELCRCARYAGLRARYIRVALSKLSTLSLPVLIKTGGAGWQVLTAIDAQTFTLMSGCSGDTTHYTPEDLLASWSGEVILLAEPGETASRQPFGFSWFMPSLRRHSAQFWRVVLASLLLQCVALVSPLFFEAITDRVLINRSLSSLDVLGVGMLALALLEPAWGFVRTWLFAGLAGKVNAELSGRLYHHLLSLPVRYFQQRQTGEIIARIREMQNVRQFLTGSSLTLLLDLVFVGVFITVMFFYSAILTSIVLISLSLYFIFWLCFGPVFRRQVLRQYERAADNTAFLTELVNGVETLRTSAAESVFLRRWETLLASYVRQSLRVNVHGIFAGQGIGLIQKVTSVFVVWWGVTLVMEGKLTPGELIAFNMYSGHVTQPILRLAQVWQDFQHTVISLRRIGDILDTQEEKGNGGLSSSFQMQGHIRFQNVHFRYTEETPEVLRDLNLDIRAGEFIGITGISGSGKSTLVQLLQRFYIPQHGHILVDGMDLAIADPLALRRNMSIIQQDSLLFSGSIADNIRQCLPQASEEAVVHAAILAGADSFIQALPEGYHTQVGENGGRLSGGQRQRIALARALITEPRILIMDEATSALDYESEAALMARMTDICRGRTVISIAHRLNTLRQADRILVMARGQITEEGTHESLMQRDTLYKKLLTLQTSS